MPFQREIEEGGPVRPEPVERPERHRTRRSSHVASGTLACPACDAPTLPEPGGMSPGSPICCGYCRHSGAVRDFLSLGEPTRPARVIVRVRVPTPTR